MGSIDDRFARFIGHEQSQDIALDTRAQLVEKALLFEAVFRRIDPFIEMRPGAMGPAQLV